jgi:hypothetical protein
MRKVLIFIILLIILADAAIFGAADYFAYLRKAHSTFENYYAFRGCVQLIEKTDAYATCKIGSGQVIKMVKYNNRWYLDGDLPACWQNICL